MDFQDMRIFARVAAMQNLSAVGTELGLTPGTISKRIQALESDLKVRLFDRTTRSIRITDEGTKFLSHVKLILQEIDLARAAVSDVRSSPKGKITVSAPVSICRRFIAPATCAFMSEYPDVEVQIDLADSIVNLQEGGYDLAIRSGHLSDSTLIRKRLYRDRLIVVASPDYLAQRGTPRTPDDLTNHNCLVLGDARQWSFRKDTGQSSVRVNGRLRSNNGEMLCHAAIGGHGLFRTSELQVLNELQSGSLTRVLEGFEVAPHSDACSDAAIWAIYPSARHVLPKLRVFLDFLSAWFRTSGDVADAGAAAPIGLVAASRKTDTDYDAAKRAANG